MKKILAIALLVTIALGSYAQKLTLEKFSSIDIDGPYKVTIARADTCAVWVEASPDMAQLVEINVVDNKLRVSCKEKIYELKKKSYVNIWIDLPELERIDAGGTSSIVMDGRFDAKGKEFEIDLDDIASIKGLEIDADRCSVNLADVSNIKMVGNFNEFVLRMGSNSSAGLDIWAEVFRCEADGNSRFGSVKASKADVNMDDTAIGRLTAYESLHVKLEGRSKLSYSGPRGLDLKMDVNPSSKLEKKLDYR